MSTISPSPVSSKRPGLSSPPRVRQIGRVHWRGLWTLYMKEVRRFLNIFTQTIFAPVVMTLLFLAIFTLALGRGRGGIEGIDYSLFLAPGLIIMAVIQNAFANSSSSILISKIQGNIVDMLMPPLSPAEFTLGIVGGGVTRGLVVGIAVLAVMTVFVPLTFHAPLFIVVFAVLGSLAMALLGLIGGIWADKFEHMSAITNFVITPLTFLSGTFYSIERLPEAWRFIAQWNPFFHMIDGFRYGFLGRADGDPWAGLLILIVLDLLLAALALTMVARGYKLKP